MFTVGEGGPLLEANEGQEQRQQRLIQQVAGNCRRRRFTTETPLERERRLENQREQRRRRRQQETTEQRENRLAQRRQRRQQETEEQRNRRLEYHRQYRQGRHELETLEQRQLRLTLANRNTTARLNNETPEQRQHRLEQLRIAQTRRLNNENEHELNQRLERLRQNDFIRRNERRHEIHDDRNTRNEYLANAWRTADQPLHQQQWAQSEMAKFHDTMNSLVHRQCVTCKETWPAKERFTPPIFECLRCKRDNGNPKLYSQENDMDPGTLPVELQGLTDIEEMLIARACPIMCVYRKHGGQRGYKGRVLSLPQDIQGFLSRLPPNVAQLPYLIIRRHGTDNTQRL